MEDMEVLEGKDLMALGEAVFSRAMVVRDAKASMTNHQITVKSKRGFTLVELVIVVLVLGIITAVAAPKMFDTANDVLETLSHVLS